MEIGQLNTLIKRLANQGVGLSQIETLKIQCSLRILQNEIKAESVYFLGKILAIKADYYIAFSTKLDHHYPTTFFSSQNGQKWVSLTAVDDELRLDAIHIQEQLTGSYISEFQTSSGRLITEEQRLSSIVYTLMQDCLLFPRGYLVETALEYVLLNPMWSGIPLKECNDLTNFRHWTPREKPLTPLEKAFSNPSLDFTAPLSSLKGWRVVETQDLDEVQLRSIYWPGFIFSLKGAEFGNCYFGNGIYEGDLFREPDQHTYAMIKPGYEPLWGKIIDRIIKEGLTIVQMKTFKMDMAFAESFYAEHVEKDFFSSLAEYMTSDTVVGLELVGPNAIAKWREIIGPTNKEVAVEKAPNSLRALYARSTTENLCHGSDSLESAARELGLVFGSN
jgi:nucleoside diphosphate kinase